METKIMNNKIESLIELAPLLKEAIPIDIMIGIADKEKYLYYVPAKNFNLGDIVGNPVPEGDPINVAMRTKQTETVVVPSDIEGISFKANGVPVKDDKGNVIGALGIGVSLEHQDRLTDMAEKFASTTEEISASTEELSASSQDLAHFMENLIKAQQDMSEQVNKTENILGFINSIASSSRILGLNAGIEAARSGEHGRGFSVVAKEITKLADSSAKSVDEIRELLNILKEKVDYIAEIVKKTTEIAEQQSASTEEISAAICSLATAAEDMEEIAQIL